MTDPRQWEVTRSSRPHREVHPQVFYCKVCGCTIAQALGISLIPTQGLATRALFFILINRVMNTLLCSYISYGGDDSIWN
jgi:hypothetical protein